MATVLLTQQMKSAKVIEQHFKKIGDTGINTSNAFGFMISCCGRGKGFHRKKNLESSCFQKL